MFRTRLKRLQEEIDKQILRIEQEENNELLEVVELYYDNFNKNKINNSKVEMCIYELIILMLKFLLIFNFNLNPNPNPSWSQINSTV